MNYNELFNEISITGSGGGHLSSEITKEVLDKWNEPHRYYHGLNHLSEILQLIKDEHWTPENGYDENMLNAAVFHDVCLDPTRNDNEEQSLSFYKNRIYKTDDVVWKMIMDTKTGVPTCVNSERFIRFDRYNLKYGDFKTVLSKTMLLFKEEQFMELNNWKMKTIKFLSNFIYSNNPTIKNVISFLEMWEPKIGIYAGSFSPLHRGHYNILQKAEQIFDKVIIAKGINPDKEKSIIKLPKVLKYHQIEYFEGLLTTFMNSFGYDMTLIRGLRNSTDLQYEMTQFQYLQDMKPDIKIVNIFSDKVFEHISSSAIRNLEKFDKEIVKKYLV